MVSSNNPVIQHQVIAYNIRLCTTTLFNMLYIQHVFRFHITCYTRGQGNIIFPVQLTTSRIGNLTWLIHTLLYVMTIHTYIAILVLLIDYSSKYKPRF